MHWLPILSVLRIWKLAWHGEPLAPLISLQTQQEALNILGYPAVTLFVIYRLLRARRSQTETGTEKIESKQAEEEKVRL